ncbi:MAG TPA: histidine phosphatase family protein [Aliidongia sp.]|nr:histidine phosphatase family protein [Aliidongia sp.]
MTMRLTLLCAAPPAGVRPGTFPDDEPADPAARVPDPGHFARLLAAPERRARATAAVLGTGALVEPTLRDCDYGAWRGRSLAEIGAADPAGAAAWLADPTAAPHGGESLQTLLDRVGGWLDHFDADGHTLAVTHPAVVRAAIVHVLAAPAAAFWRIDVEPLSLTDLRRHAGRWTLRSVGLAAPR